MVTIRLLEQVAAEHFVGLNGISRGVEARKNVSSILWHICISWQISGSVSSANIMHLSFEDLVICQS